MTISRRTDAARLLLKKKQILWADTDSPKDVMEEGREPVERRNYATVRSRASSASHSRGPHHRLHTHPTTRARRGKSQHKGGEWRRESQVAIHKGNQTTLEVGIGTDYKVQLPKVSRAACGLLYFIRLLKYLRG
jgi:hypothetical protein